MFCSRYNNTVRTESLKRLLTTPYLRIKVKVQWSRYRPGVAQRVGRGIALLFLDRGTRRGEWSAARPSRTLPLGRTRYPLYRRLGVPQGQSSRAVKLVPTGIRFRTVQPVVSRYTNWATRPTHVRSTCANLQRLILQKDIRVHKRHTNIYTYSGRAFCSCISI